MPKKLDLTNVGIEKIEEEEKELLSVRRTNANSQFYKKLAEDVVHAKNPEMVKINLGTMTLTQARSVVAEMKRFLPEGFAYRPVPRQSNDGKYSFIGFLKSE